MQRPGDLPSNNYHEGLRVDDEIGEPARPLEDFSQCMPGKLGLLLKERENIGEKFDPLHVAYARRDLPVCRNARLRHIHFHDGRSDTRRFNGFDLPHSRQRSVYQLRRVEGDPVASTVLYTLPQLLEVRTKLNLLAEPQFTPLPGVHDPILEYPSVHLVDNRGFQLREFRRYLQVETRVPWIEIVENVSRLAEISLFKQLGPNPIRVFLADLILRTIASYPDKPGESDPLDFAKTDAEILLEFSLQLAREVLVRLIRDNGKPIDRLIMYALAGFINRQPQPAPDFLALLLRRLCLVQRANLEHVRIVPSPPATRNAKR